MNVSGSAFDSGLKCCFEALAQVLNDGVGLLLGGSFYVIVLPDMKGQGAGLLGDLAGYLC